MKTPIGCLALALALAPPSAAQFVESVTTIHTWDGTNPGDGWGVVRVLGDLDADGVPEYGVGVPGNNDNGLDAGRFFIFSGASGDTLRTHVKGAGAHFGYDFGAVGDVDDDGVSDYVVTAPRTRNFINFNLPSIGRAFLFSGATGAQLHNWAGSDWGAGVSQGFGSFVAGAGNVSQNGIGDVNNDGVPDIMIGANIGATGFGGQMHVFSGAKE